MAVDAKHLTNRIVLIEDRRAGAARLVLFPLGAAVAGALAGFVVGLLPYFGLEAPAAFERFFWSAIFVGTGLGMLSGFLLAHRQRSDEKLEGALMLARYRQAQKERDPDTNPDYVLGDADLTIGYRA